MVALRILVAFTGLFAAIQVWCIGLSLLGVGMTQPLAVLGLALALVGATALAFRFGHGDEVQELASRPCAPAGEGSKGGRARSIVALATGAAYLWLGWIWVRLLHLAWEREPLGWDALWYHIPAIHEWVLRGQGQLSHGR